MMTLRKATPPESSFPSSSAAQTRILNPLKAKLARQRRLDIHKFKSTCRDVKKPHQHEHQDRRTCAPPPHATCESHGAVSVMGRRREMEDAVSVVVSESAVSYGFFGVYDGHGGRHVAEACRERMHVILEEEVGDTWREGGNGVDWEGVMVRCFERMDGEVGGAEVAAEEMNVGSTAVVAVLGKEEVVVANCGDSRAVICRSGVAVPLSFDHKPDRPDELARIEAAGGRVINWNGFRVLGVLATSRSIGDHYLKPYVSCTPEVTVSKRTEEDEFLILATDGLWDVISNEVACQVVRRCLTGRIQRRSTNSTDELSRNSRAELAAALLTELAMAKGSKDNISVIVVELKRLNRFTCS